MENYKSRIIVGIGILLFIAFVVGIFYYLETFESIYYTKIDNTKITKLDTTDSLKYEYALNAYDKNGKKRKIEFKTYRELKEGAYLSLVVKPTGVNKWEEVKFDDLPSKVQEQFQK